MTVVKIETNDACSVCLSENLEQIFDMPQFPMIGIYTNTRRDEDFPPIDQELCICRDCGHIQLRNNVDPAVLYGEAFTHRTGASESATAASEFFAAYIKKVANGRRFKRIVEIGCNDTSLLGSLLDIGDVACGVDPIWRGREHEFAHDPDSQTAERIRVIGAFAEEVDFDTALGGKPDLIVSSFTLEHLKRPREVVERLMEACSDDALFVLQVPGTDMLLDNCRFDQLSHQHYQQFTLDSFTRMMVNAGGKILSYCVNYLVWGAIIIAFSKGPGSSEPHGFRRASRELVLERKRLFDLQLDTCRQMVAATGDRPIYGLGAAQNLPSLAYFMGSDLDFMAGILDDDPARQNKYYPGLNPRTMAPTPDLTLGEAAVVITGPDYARPLVRRAAELGVRQCILPIQTI